MQPPIAMWLPRFDSQLIHSPAHATCVTTTHRQYFSRQKMDKKRVTQAWNDWHEHIYLSPLPQTNGSWHPPMLPSATAHETAFDLRQYKLCPLGTPGMIYLLTHGDWPEEARYTKPKPAKNMVPVFTIGDFLQFLEC